MLSALYSGLYQNNNSNHQWQTAMADFVTRVAISTWKYQRYFSLIETIGKNVYVKYYVLEQRHYQRLSLCCKTFRKYIDDEHGAEDFF